jgi:hypothetical protein
MSVRHEEVKYLHQKRQDAREKTNSQPDLPITEITQARDNEPFFCRQSNSVPRLKSERKRKEENKRNALPVIQFIVDPCRNNLNLKTTDRREISDAKDLDTDKDQHGHLFELVAYRLDPFR